MSKKTTQAVVCTYSRASFLEDSVTLFRQGYRVIPGTVSSSVAVSIDNRDQRIEERYVAFFEKEVVPESSTKTD